MFRLIEKMNKSIKVAYLYLILGIVISCIFVVITVNTSSFLSQAIEAKGYVVEIVKNSSGIESKYFPKVEYIDQDGSKKFFLSNSGGNVSSYNPGDEVVVLYVPHEDNERIKDISSVFGGSLVTFIVGFSFLIFGFLNIRKLRVGRE